MGCSISAKECFHLFPTHLPTYCKGQYARKCLDHALLLDCLYTVSPHFEAKTSPYIAQPVEHKSTHLPKLLSLQSDYFTISRKLLLNVMFSDSIQIGMLPWNTYYTFHSPKNYKIRCLPSFPYSWLCSWSINIFRYSWNLELQNAHLNSYLLNGMSALSALFITDLTILVGC